GAGGTPDVRVIAASDADLQDAVLRQRFRGDLYYLLAAIRIDVPPLRDRGGDVALIARQMLNELAGGRLGAIRDIEPAALEALQRYTWPGNLRQLRAVLSRALAIADGPMLRGSHLPAEVVEPAAARRPMAGAILTLAELARLHIEEALAPTGAPAGGDRRAGLCAAPHGWRVPDPGRARATAHRRSTGADGWPSRSGRAPARDPSQHAAKEARGIPVARKVIVSAAKSAAQPANWSERDEANEARSALAPGDGMCRGGELCGFADGRGPGRRRTGGSRCPCDACGGIERERPRSAGQRHDRYAGARERQWQR